MKSGVRIAAITTGPIGKLGKRKGGWKALLVCVVGNLNGVEGILSTKIAIDGNDATEKIIRLIRRTHFREQIRVLAFNGIALAGLNIVNVDALEKSLGVSCLILTRQKPHLNLLKRSVRLLKIDKKEKKERMALLSSQKRARKMNGFYVQTSLDETRKLSKICADLLRLSHLISRGIATGESKGRI